MRPGQAWGFPSAAGTAVLWSCCTEKQKPATVCSKVEITSSGALTKKYLCVFSE